MSQIDISPSLWASGHVFFSASHTMSTFLQQCVKLETVELFKTHLEDPAIFLFYSFALCLAVFECKTFKTHLVHISAAYSSFFDASSQ